MSRDSRSTQHYFDVAAREYQSRSEGAWWQILRRREVAAVMEMLEPQAGERILDAGCGAGFYTRLIAERGVQVVGLDQSPAMVAEARKWGLEVFEGSLEGFQLPSPPFDKILCAGALEFCRSPRLALRRFHHHLKPGGRLVLLVPMNTLTGLLYQFYHRTHGLSIRLFTADGLRRLAEAEGFAELVERRPTFSWVFQLEKTAEPPRKPHSQD
ncbi:MAG: methyltransferase domain-containing protein [bacterium]